MPTLRLRFRIWLDETVEERFDDDFTPHGPLFHRWLPDGIADALTLQSGDSSAELRVWFERLGYIRENQMLRAIVFDSDRRELDPAIMTTQGILQAGPLCGGLVLHGLTDEEIAPLREFVTNEQRKQSTDYYSRLGKRVVKLLQPPVTHFLDVLRINFGQYWIKALESWDSRKESLGQYCFYTLGLHWSLDNEDTWEHFIPTQMEGRINVKGRSDQDFLEYLSREDWAKLEQVVGEIKSPSLAARILVQAHRLRDQGDLRYALIEGVTALELALDEHLAYKLAGSTDLSTITQTFKGQLSLPAKLSVIALHIPAVSLKDIELAVKGISMRNKVAHEGEIVPQEAGSQLDALLRIVAALLPTPTIRLPSRDMRNAWRSSETWEQIKKSE